MRTAFVVLSVLIAGCNLEPKTKVGGLMGESANTTGQTDKGAANAGGWLNLQSVGGGIGLVICFAIFAWTITKAYSGMKCRAK